MSDQGNDIRQTCSINGKLCVNGIRSDFETDHLIQRQRPCNKWVRLIGTEPQTGKNIDEWCCNEWAKVKIGVENSQMIRQVIASTDKVANQVQKSRAEFLGALSEEAQKRLINADPKIQQISSNGG